MQTLRLPTDLEEFHRVSAIGETKDIPFIAAARYCYRLGMAAAEAGWQPQENIDRLVTDPPLVAA